MPSAAARHTANQRDPFPGRGRSSNRSKATATRSAAGGSVVRMCAVSLRPRATRKQSRPKSEVSRIDVLHGSRRSPATSPERLANGLPRIQARDRKGQQQPGHVDHGDAVSQPHRR